MSPHPAELARMRSDVAALSDAVTQKFNALLAAHQALGGTLPQSLANAASEIRRVHAEVGRFLTAPPRDAATDARIMASLIDVQRHTLALLADMERVPTAAPSPQPTAQQNAPQQYAPEQPVAPPPMPWQLPQPTPAAAAPVAAPPSTVSLSPPQAPPTGRPLTTGRPTAAPTTAPPSAVRAPTPAAPPRDASARPVPEARPAPQAPWPPQPQPRTQPPLPWQQSAPMPGRAVPPPPGATQQPPAAARPTPMAPQAAAPYQTAAPWPGPQPGAPPMHAMPPQGVPSHLAPPYAVPPSAPQSASAPQLAPTTGAGPARGLGEPPGFDPVQHGYANLVRASAHDGHDDAHDSGEADVPRRGMSWRIAVLAGTVALGALVITGVYLAGPRIGRVVALVRGMPAGKAQTDKQAAAKQPPGAIRAVVKADTGAPSAPSATGRYVPVLATFSDYSAAREAFVTLKQRYPDLLGSTAPDIETVTVPDGGTWHRLGVLPALPRDQAQALCQQLQAAGHQGCWIRPQG